VSCRIAKAAIDEDACVPWSNGGATTGRARSNDLSVVLAERVQGRLRMKGCIDDH